MSSRRAGRQAKYRQYWKDAQGQRLQRLKRSDDSGMTDISSQTLHIVAKELAATLNDARASLEAYAERFIDPSMAFAVGWNYWLSWTVTLAAELVAGALIV